MGTMFRRWLRKMIGWDELEARMDLKDSVLAVLVERSSTHDVDIADQKRRIDLIAYRRDLAPKRTPELDWEAQQAEFYSNPDNFKEVN